MAAGSAQDGPGRAVAARRVARPIVGMIGLGELLADRKIIQKKIDLAVDTKIDLWDKQLSEQHEQGTKQMRDQALEDRKEIAYLAGLKAGHENKPCYSVCPYDQQTQEAEYFSFLDGHEDGQNKYGFGE